VSDQTQVVEVRVPADPGYIRIVRLAASGVAAMAGFDVERIEDLRIAVDEMCTTLIEVGAGGPLVVRFRPPSRSSAMFGIEVESDHDPGATPDDERFMLSRTIVGVIADEHDLQLGSDGVSRYVIAVGVGPRPSEDLESSAGG
jgi:hypothetical protein